MRISRTMRVEGLNDEQRSNVQKQAKALLSFVSSLLEALR